jgi:hypothetical protein
MRCRSPVAVALLCAVVACLPERGRNSVSDGGRPLSPVAVAAAVAAPAPPPASSLVLRADSGTPPPAIAR